MNVRRVIPKDAIPSVDAPTFVTAAAADLPTPADEQVVVVDPADWPGEPSADDDEWATGAVPPRAYPLRYLDHHEIVNDRVGGRPIAVTWCPLCASAVVYDRRVAGKTVTDHGPTDGRALTLEFGVSGKLADDDLVMYDRETDSEWKQSTGRAIAGVLTGTRLEPLPAAVMPAARFLDAHPDGRVLAPPGGASETAGDGTTPEPVDYAERPYQEYFDRDGVGLAAHRNETGRGWDRDRALSPKAVVLGLERDGSALGFPLERVRAAGGLVRTTVGETAVLVVATEAAGIHAYRDPAPDATATLIDDAGRLRVDDASHDPATGRPLEGQTGTGIEVKSQNESDAEFEPRARAEASTTTRGDGLQRLPARRLFARAWADDHGPEAFWRPAAGDPDPDPDSTPATGSDALHDTGERR